MPLPLFQHLPDIEAQLAGAGVLLLLDYDGTLRPITPEPAAAWIDWRVARLLQRLGRRPHVQVAILSGRRLDDVREKAGLPDLIYSGNHGLEISGPGVEFVHPAVRDGLPALRFVARDLRERLQTLPGAFVEDKRLTASVHYRLTPPELVPAVFAHADAAVAPYLDALRLSPGRKVIEIRPKLDWTKGEAVAWIQDVYRCRDYTPVYVGDDTTDEDVFRRLPGGVTIRVGGGESRATYRVDAPADVEAFLAWLADYSG